MRKLLVLYRFTLLFACVATVPAVFAAEHSVSGVTRMHIEGVDNWAWNDTPLAAPNNFCPGGELVEDPGVPAYCDNSKTGRMHFRDGASWACMTTNDPRMTGVGAYTTNGNFDANSTGPVWGTWMIVPMEDCDKDGPYPEELVMNATSFWEGTWNGQRRIYNVNGFNYWVGELKVLGQGFGGDLEGLQFKGMEWITTYTPSPIPYEFLPPALGLFDEPEAVFMGTIKE